MRFAAKLALYAIALTGACHASAGTVSLSCPPSAYVRVDDAEGYNALYMVNGLSGVSLTYTASSPSATVTCVAYTDQGEAYGTDVSGIQHSGTNWTIPAVATQTSYLFMEGAQSQRVRVIDYTPYRFSPLGFTVGSADADCGLVRVHCQGAEEIPYYTPVGLRRTLSRELHLSYIALAEDEATGTLVDSAQDRVLPSIPAAGITVDSPMQATDITLSGDRFSTAFSGSPTSVTVPFGEPKSVIGATTAVCLTVNGDNVNGVSPTPDHFGGSGPVEMQFTAQVNSAADFLQWQVSASSDFSTLLYTYPYLDYKDTFNNPGTTFVRFYAANAAGTCSYTSKTYTIDVGASMLECPNAFSPNDDGVNDLWKVSYRSLSEFDCHIFNRWGQEVAHLKHPSEGWDGKSGGRKVPAGAYYYVIKAKGSDGRNYKLSGDINIIYYR